MDYRVLVLNRNDHKQRGLWIDLPISEPAFGVVLEALGVDSFGYELRSCEFVFPFPFPDVDINTLNDLVRLHQHDPDVFNRPPIISEFEIDGTVVSIVWVEIDDPEDN